MGVRLMRFDKKNILGGPEANINDHDELVNRDLLNQHPIYSITGLQEVLNTLEDEDYELSKLIVQKDTAINTRIDNIQRSITSINQDIITIYGLISSANTIDTIIDTDSIYLTYDSANNSLRADVKIYDDYNNNNSIIVTPNGLFSPSIHTKDTNSISWANELNTQSIAISDLPSFFAHYYYSWSENYFGNYFSYNSTNKIEYSTVWGNTNGYGAKISTNYYDSYVHRVTITQHPSYTYNTSYNGFGGIVIGYVYYSGYWHTLSVGVSPSTYGYKWGFIYDFCRPSGNQTINMNLITPLNAPTTWYNHKITIEVQKQGNIITAKCSNWDEDVINPDTEITIDLNDYSWGSMFAGKVRYGYGSAYSYLAFSDASFTSTDIESSTFIPSVKLSSTANNELVINSDGLYAPKFVTDPISTNALKKNDAGYYVEAFQISSDSGNAIVKKSSGYYAEAFQISPDAYNMITKRSNGYYVEQFHLSAAANNAIIKNVDGYYAPSFLISAKTDNVLKKETDGYYVEDFKISSESENCLIKKTDGYYVREQANVKSVLQPTHGFVVGDFIYYHPDNKYQKALAKDDYDSNIIGMVTKVTDENIFEYQPSGFFKTNIFNTNHGFVQGMPLYISDANPGETTQIQPDISKAVGYPVEDIGIIISIERGIQYNQENIIGDFKMSANDYNVRSDGFIRIVSNVEYRMSLVSKLLNKLSDEFKENYMIIYDDMIQFKNIDDIYIAQNVPHGLHLYIKAF